jgi:hypothetical protein
MDRVGSLLTKLSLGTWSKASLATFTASSVSKPVKARVRVRIRANPSPLRVESVQFRAAARTTTPPPTAKQRSTAAARFIQKRAVSRIATL